MCICVCTMKMFYGHSPLVQSSSVIRPLVMKIAYIVVWPSGPGNHITSIRRKKNQGPVQKFLCLLLWLQPQIPLHLEGVCVVCVVHVCVCVVQPQIFTHTNIYCRQDSLSVPLTQCCSWIAPPVYCLNTCLLLRLPHSMQIVDSIVTSLGVKVQRKALNRDVICLRWAWLGCIKKKEEMKVDPLSKEFSVSSVCELFSAEPVVKDVYSRSGKPEYWHRRRWYFSSEFSLDLWLWIFAVEDQLPLSVQGGGPREGLL